jgi:hypothetical protein
VNSTRILIFLLLGLFLQGNSQNTTVYFNHPDKHKNRSGAQLKYNNDQSHIQLVNNTKTFGLRKYDSLNTILWEYDSDITFTAGTSSYVTARDFYKLPNDHILVIGDSLVFGGVAFSSVTFFITEFDPLGNRLWTNNHVYTTFYSFENAKITPLGNGTLAVFGGSFRMEIDLAGNILNQQSNHLLQEDYVMKDSSTFFQLLHTSVNVLAEVNAQLDTVWTKPIAFRGQQMVYDHNALYVTGILESNGGTTDVKIAKFNTQGQVLWDQTIHFPDISTCKDIILHHNNVFITGDVKDCQNTNTNNACAGQFKTFILAYDTNGNALSQYFHSDSTFSNRHQLDSGYHSKAVGFVVDPKDNSLHVYGNKEGFDLTPSVMNGVNENGTVDNPYAFLTAPIYSPTAVSATEVKHDFLVYPNPGSDEIHIRANQYKSASFYDLAGVSRLYSENETINLNSLAKGLYIIKITLQGGETRGIRFFKQ